MKSWLFIFVLSMLISNFVVAKDRCIYLWDVTLSMKGFSKKGATPNIYNDVVSFLERQINQCNSSETDLYVIPFQIDVLDVWTNENGNDDLLKKVKEYNNTDMTSTNISGPFERVYNQYAANANMTTCIFILTDGQQSNKYGGRTELYDVLERWGTSVSNNNGMKVYYVMLTQNAVDKTIVEMSKTIPNLNVIDQTIFLKPDASVYYNASSNGSQDIKLSFASEEVLNIPDNVKLRITCNSHHDVIPDQVVDIYDNSIVFMVDRNQLLNYMGSSLRLEMDIDIEILNQKELQDNDGKLVQINPSRTRLIVERNPVRRITIRYN